MKSTTLLFSHSEKQTKERFNQIKAEMTEVEGENERLQVILKQKETEINDIREVSSSFFFLFSSSMFDSSLAS